MIRSLNVLKDYDRKIKNEIQIFMNEQQEILEVIDENDNVIGLESREKIHKEGLLHREIYVWFFTSKGEMIFQHRAKNKDTYPDLLDATVGGHVEPGMSYEETVIKECKEETGINIDPKKLFLLTKMRKKSFDKATGKINNTIRAQYAYLFKDSINNLKVEKGKAEGFEVWSDLSNLSDVDKNKFIPFFLSEEFLSIFKKARSILFKQ